MTPLPPELPTDRNRWYYSRLLGGAALVGVGGGCHGHDLAADEPRGDRFWNPQGFADRLDRFGMRIDSVEIVDPQGPSPRHRYLIRKARP